MSILVVGDVALDVVARHATPIAAGTDTPAAIRTAPGGAAANCAVWLAHLGAPATLVACVGDDPAGRILTEALAATAVDVRLRTVEGRSSGGVIVLVDAAGERTMLPDRGANAALAPDDVAGLLGGGHRHLHLSGYVLGDPASCPAGIAILRAAATAGLTTSVDPQAASLVAADPAGFLHAVHGVDVLLPNTDELAALTGSRDPASAADLLDVVGAVAVTDGPAGATWLDQAGTHHVAAEVVEVTDTVGCGDALDAGLLAAWHRGMGPAESLAAGVWAGTRAATLTGPWPPAS